ncbi:MAG: N-acetylmuramoyl-L-alanine amidase [Cycloclasticus sp.]
MSKFRAITRIQSIVIHCSATPNGRRTTVEDIDDWHKNRNFKRNPELAGNHMPHLGSIGYHHVIYANGATGNGRRYCETGAHTLDVSYPKGDGRRYQYNNNSIGICMVGTDLFSFEQWETLRVLIKALKDEFPSITKVIGHRSINPNKTCPGFNVKTWLSGGMLAPAMHILESP